MSNVLRIGKVFYYNFIVSHGRVTKSLQIDVTNKCNLRCKGCYHFQKNKNFKDQSLKDWGILFQQYKRMGVHNIWLLGGEPTLRMDLVQKIYESFPLVYLVTNGINRIDSKLSHLRIFVSLDGDAKYNDAFRGDNVHDRIIQNYTNDPRVIFNSTITKKNINQIEYLIVLSKQINISGVGFQFYSPSETSDRATIMEYALTETDFDQAEKILSKYYKDPKVFITKKVFESLRDSSFSEQKCLFKKYLDCYYADGTKKRCCSPSIKCSDCRILPVHLHHVIDTQKDISTYLKFLKWL
jgi:MoaA/NifB/PqqE/SkfB family radical SAM enzyme